MSSPNTSHFSHWILIAFAYGCVCFLSVLWLDSPRQFPLMVITAVLIATTQWMAAWSVLGTGGYLARATSAMSIGAIVIGAAVLGAYLMSGAHRSQVFQVALTITFIIPMFFCASQIPYWILRAVFGYQFVLNRQPPAPSFQLRDLFAITFVFAIAFVGLQASSSISASMYNEILMELDPQNTNAHLSMNSQISNGILISSLIYSFVFTIISTLMMPFVFFVFRAKNIKRSLINCCVAVSIALVSAIIVFSIQTGGFIGIGGGAATLLCFLVLAVFLFVLPLFITRTQGLSLTKLVNLDTNQPPLVAQEVV